MKWLISFALPLLVLTGCAGATYNVAESMRKGGYKQVLEDTRNIEEFPERDQTLILNWRAHAKMGLGYQESARNDYLRAWNMMNNSAGGNVAAAYACQRQQFKQPIIDFQAVGFMLADMACKTETARLLVHKAACLRDRGDVYTHVAAMAKCVATDAGLAVSQDAVQVLGGYGYTREYPVERYMRDSKVMQIVEGTNQVQRLVIARHLKRQYEGA